MLDALCAEAFLAGLGSGGALRAPTARSGAVPRPKLILMHFGAAKVNLIKVMPLPPSSSFSLISNNSIVCYIINQLDSCSSFDNAQESKQEVQLLQRGRNRDAPRRWKFFVGQSRSFKITPLSRVLVKFLLIFHCNCLSCTVWNIQRRL